MKFKPRFIQNSPPNFISGLFRWTSSTKGGREVAGELLERARLFSRRIAHSAFYLRRFIVAPRGVFFEQTVGLPDGEMEGEQRFAHDVHKRHGAA